MDDITTQMQQLGITDEKQKEEEEEDTIKIYGLQQWNRAAGLKCQYNPPPNQQKTPILPTPISEINENNKLQNNVLHLDYDNNNDSYNQLSANKVTKEHIQLIIQLQSLNKPSNTLPFIFIPSAKRWKNAQLLLNENNSANTVFIVIDDDDKDKNRYIKRITEKNKPYHFIITLNQLSSGVPMVRQAIKMCAEYLLSHIHYEDNKYWIEIDDDINGFEYEYNHLNVTDGLHILYKSMLKIRKESSTKPIIMSVGSNKDRATNFDELKPYTRSLKCERVRIFKYCEELRNVCYVDQSTRIMNKEQWDLIKTLRRSKSKSDIRFRQLVQGKFGQGEDYGICEKLFNLFCLKSNINNDNGFVCLVNKAIKYNAQWGPGVKSVAGTVGMKTITNALKYYDEMMNTKDTKIWDITIEKLPYGILQKYGILQSEWEKKRKITTISNINNKNNENNSSNTLQSKPSYNIKNNIINESTTKRKRKRFLDVYDDSDESDEEKEVTTEDDSDEDKDTYDAMDENDLDVDNDSDESDEEEEVTTEDNSDEDEDTDDAEDDDDDDGVGAKKNGYKNNKKNNKEEQDASSSESESDEASSDEESSHSSSSSTDDSPIVMSARRRRIKNDLFSDLDDD